MTANLIDLRLLYCRQANRNSYKLQ